MLPEASNRMYAAEEFLEGSPQPALNREDQPELQRSRPRILIVDDFKIIADTLVEILKNDGFDAAAAYDGCEAMEVAARFEPDFLLSDVLMPRMNGVELAIAIQKNYPKTHILLFSGQAGISEILMDGRRQGYEFELIAKPIHPLKLLERIKQL